MVKRGPAAPECRTRHLPPEHPPTMDEAALISKLAKIEALFAGATTEGERAAAASARDRIVARLREVEKADPPIEFKFTLADAWSHRLLLALLRRYGLKPYR